MDEIIIHSAKNRGIACRFTGKSVIKGIASFYGKGNETILAALQEDSLWEELCKNLTRNVSFRINGEPTIIPEDEELVNFYLNSLSDHRADRESRTCLITGEKGSLVELTTATPILGSQATAKLVAFQVDSGYDSYGKEKAYNAPISHDAEFAYTTTLTHLLRKESRNMFRIATRTYVFGHLLFPKLEWKLNLAFIP